MTNTMKKSQQNSFIAACLLPALLAMTPVAFAEDAAGRYIKQEDTLKPAPAHWTIPPVNKQWKAPPRRDAWTIPPASRQWGHSRSPHWTIPRTAADLLPADD
jgi:hypothetical protein